MTASPSIVGCILTRNEERSIERSISSLLGVTEQVVVVDSESTDATREVAAGLGAHVVVHHFESFPAQRNWAIDHIMKIHNPEFMITIDADEWLTEALSEDIQDRAGSGRLKADAYLFHRRIHFDGRDLRWGGFANTWLPRLFRPDTARYEDRGVNEHLILLPGARVERLAGYLVNDDVVSWEDYVTKHNRYSTLEARARVVLALGHETPTTLRDAIRRPYLRRRWLRQHVWDRLPARPAIRFIQIYLFAGGMLDGRPGFRRALFEAWQEMCTDLKAEALVNDRHLRNAFHDEPHRSGSTHPSPSTYYTDH